MNHKLEFDCFFNFHFKKKVLFEWNCFAPLDGFYDKLKKDASEKAIPEASKKLPPQPDCDTVCERHDSRQPVYEELNLLDFERLRKYCKPPEEVETR